MWLLNEDASLKSLLQGIYVTDANAPPEGRKVPVIFKLPETEVNTLTYPIIVIEHLSWTRDPEREHRGYIRLPYAPENLAPWWGDNGPNGPPVDFDPNDSPYQTHFPIPYNFDYQVTVMTRLWHEHMLPIIAELAQFGRLHPHFGFLDVPQDGTKRSLFLNGGPTAGAAMDDNDKHLLTTVYNVRVCSELLGPIDSLVQYGGTQVPATQFNVDLGVYSDLADITGPELETSFGILSVGTASTWNTQQQ